MHARQTWLRVRRLKDQLAEWIETIRLLPIPVRRPASYRRLIECVLARLVQGVHGSVPLRLPTDAALCPNPSNLRTDDGPPRAAGGLLTPFASWASLRPRSRLDGDLAGRRPDTLPRGRPPRSKPPRRRCVSRLIPVLGLSSNRNGTFLNERRALDLAKASRTKGWSRLTFH